MGSGPNGILTSKMKKLALLVNTPLIFCSVCLYLLGHSKKRLVIYTYFLPTSFVDFHFPDSTNGFVDFHFADSTNGFVEFTYQFVNITNLLPISFHFPKAFNESFLKV
jgi:hypothetical protein